MLNFACGIVDIVEDKPVDNVYKFVNNFEIAV